MLVQELESGELRALAASTEHLEHLVRITDIPEQYSSAERHDALLHFSSIDETSKMLRAKAVFRWGKSITAVFIGG